MQFPESWLREFCNPPLTTQALADTLTMAGLEVEDLQPVAPAFTNIVVGEIQHTEPHPNADRLRVCQVNVGAAELLHIVCGAPNARVGIKVPCAQVGAQLPPGQDGQPFLIKVGKLRGVPSYGMLCSARELGLSALASDHAGLLELPLDAPVGQDVREYLQLDDTLFTLKLTPNLAHCLSVYGVAREVAALTGSPLKAPPIPTQPNTYQSAEPPLPVHIEAPDLCGRFTGRVVRGINPQAPTPQWMVQRLARCGQRSVAPLVDISNYVMFELGRPSHIFDLDRIHGSLQVRWGRSGETLKLLNGSTVTVDDKVGVIADEQAVESLAGIMGGDATAVSDATQNIYIEAAFWWPQAIAGRARRYHFSTDAAHRFERGVDPQHTVEHIERITELVLQICGTSHTVCGPITDQQPRMPQKSPVTLRVARACKVIGMPLTLAQCVDALQRLGLPVTHTAHDPAQGGQESITVTPPSYRFDLTIEEDLIEEVARIVGYHQLPHTAPLAPISPKLPAEATRSPFAVRHMLADLGYQETINFSFVEERWEHELAGNPTPIKLLNPIASQMSVMRSSLLASLLQVLKFNLDRKTERVRVFELGRVFLRDPNVPHSDTTVEGFHQPMRVAGLAYGGALPLQWGASAQAVDFFDVKGDVQTLLAPLVPQFEGAQHPAMHPGRCARVLVAGRVIGFVGELHPRWCQSWALPQTPVLFELELDAVLARPMPQCTSVSKHQAVERDLAVVVAESVTHAQLMQVIESALPAQLLRGAVLFDVYRPKPLRSGETATAGSLATGEKSLAVRLTLGHEYTSLTETEIEPAMQAVIAALATQIGAKLRA